MNCPKCKSPVNETKAIKRAGNQNKEAFDKDSNMTFGKCACGARLSFVNEYEGYGKYGSRTVHIY